MEQQRRAADIRQKRVTSQAYTECDLLDAELLQMIAAGWVKVVFGLDVAFLTEAGEKMLSDLERAEYDGRTS